MDDFSFSMPTDLEFGRNKELEVGELTRRFGGTRALVLYGGGSAVRSGLVDRVMDSLEQVGIDHIELGGVCPNPLDTLVYKGIRTCRDHAVDFVLPIGGGSVIDTGKAIAAGVPHEGDFWDFYGGDLTPGDALPIGVVLTIAASGSEASPDSVITQASSMLKRETSSRVLLPRFSIMDPELTCTLPPYQTACGIIDMLSHLLERYLTNTDEVETSDRMIEGVMLAIMEEAPKAMADPHDYEARANLMWAACMAHNNLCGVGRSQDWASHDIEYALSSDLGCAHGAGLAVVMPAYMTYVLGHDIGRLAQLACRVWGCSEDAADPARTALAGIEHMRGFARSLGMPTTLGELGGTEGDVARMAHETCWAGGRTGTVGGFVPLDESAVEAVLRLAL
jgi:alcohol dehydrogenase YqhD (iron-dependent ADH family)